MISSVSAANLMRISHGKKKKQESIIRPSVCQGRCAPLTRRPLTDIGLMIEAAKRMTAQNASPSSTIKEETSKSQSLCNPGCNLPEGIHFQPTMASGRNERGCISFYNLGHNIRRCNLPKSICKMVQNAGIHPYMDYL